MAEKQIKEAVVLTATVGEIGMDEGKIVQIPTARLERINSADPEKHPAKFVTVEVESGWSKNKRHWPPAVLDSIANQIAEKEPVGYKGHPLLKKDFDKGSDYPDPQTLWMGAISTLSEKGKRLLVKGYNLTDQIRRELASGATRTVSICGDATMRAVKGGYEVEDFELESIDWARPGGQGMAGGVVALTAEQTAEEIQEDEEVELVKPEDIANLTEGDLRKHNSSLADQIEGVGFEKGKREVEEKVGEQEAALKEGTEAVDLVKAVREKLGLKDDDSLTDAISKLVNDSREGLKSEFKDAVEKLLAKKIPDEKIRNLVSGLVGEMDSSVEDSEGVQADAKEKVNAMLDANKDTITDFIGEMDEEDDDEDKPKRKRTLSPAHRPEERRGSKKDKKDTENIAHETVEV